VLKFLKELKFLMKNKNNKELSFLQHLEVLRWHLIRSAAAILIFSIVAFIFKDFIFDSVILAPKNSTFFTNRMFCYAGKYFGLKDMCINDSPLNIININMSGQFSTHVTISIMAGFIAAFPYVFWEFWRFILPALNKKERTNSRGTVFFASILFTLGSMFGYFLIMPLSVEFFGNYAVSKDVVNNINLDSYIDTFTSAVLASGIVFELPIFIFFLTKIGLITPAFLKKYRKHALILILFIAAVITPPDVFSQILVSIPLYSLYEISILVSKRIVKKNNNLLV